MLRSRKGQATEDTRAHEEYEKASHSKPHSAAFADIISCQMSAIHHYYMEYAHMHAHA